MERGEPTLVPEWLRNTGSVSGVGNSAQHLVLSSSNTDVSASTHHTRNRNPKTNNDFDSPRSAFLDRSSSSNSRRNSSNGSAKNAYSSFGRSHRNRDRDRDKEKLSFGDHWDHDSDAFGSILISRSEKNVLHRSYSMVSRKQVDGSPQRVSVDLKNGNSCNHVNGNGLVSPSSVNTKSQNRVFEKDFPSLDVEERQRTPEIGRVASPGLSSAIQSLPVSSSALIGGERWTSALAQVPNIIRGGTTGSSSAVQTSVTSAPGIPSALAGLNMAEALTQAPSRARSAPQILDQTQRLEELAMRQSRQLIPVTPSMPKSLVLSSDKSKSKMVVRSGEMTTAAKSVRQQQSSALLSVNQPNPGGQIKSDPSKTSFGKLFILKQNGVSPSPKDVASPTVNAGKIVSSQATASAVAQSAPSRSPKNIKVSSSDRKSASLDLISGFGVEKRPSSSQTQSRNDFFKLLKEKTTAYTSTVLPDSTSVVSSPGSDKSFEASKDVASAPGSPKANKNGVETNCNGGHCEEFQRFSEEETAFLRSLGWEESTDEDEGLTEEEISAFYQEYIKLRPSLKVSHSVQQKLLKFQTSNLARASAELRLSDTGSEAGCCSPSLQS